MATQRSDLFTNKHGTLIITVLVETVPCSPAAKFDKKRKIRLKNN